MLTTYSASPNTGFCTRNIHNIPYTEYYFVIDILYYPELPASGTEIGVIYSFGYNVKYNLSVTPSLFNIKRSLPGCSLSCRFNLHLAHRHRSVRRRPHIGAGGSEATGGGRGVAMTPNTKNTAAGCVPAVQRNVLGPAERPPLPPPPRPRTLMTSACLCACACALWLNWLFCAVPVCDPSYKHSS